MTRRAAAAQVPILLLAAGLSAAGCGGHEAGAPARAEAIRIAAAADLKYAMDEVAAAFLSAHPGARVEVVYGSSGRFRTQIAHGAPFDLFFSADIAYPQALIAEGRAVGEPIPYAVGRLVVWTLSRHGAPPQLEDLAGEAVGRVALANPRHAPYGQRAREALERSGLWERVEPKLVFGENVAQAAQFVESGAADAGLVALSLVLSPALEGRGSWVLVPETLHEPLEQGFVIALRAERNPLALAFAEFVRSEPSRTVLRRYGFVLPGE